MELPLEVELNHREEPVHCSVGAARRRLNAEDGRALVAAIENEEVRLTRIVDVMRRRGIELSESALRRHRKGRCSCGVGKGSGGTS